jgi:hypothetical protein
MKNFIILSLVALFSFQSFGFEMDQDSSEFYKVVRALERKVKALDGKKAEIEKLKTFLIRCEDALKNHGGKIAGSDMAIIEQVSVGGFIASTLGFGRQVVHLANGYKFTRKQVITFAGATLVILSSSFFGMDYIHTSTQEIIDMKKTIALSELELKRSRAVLVKILDDYRNKVTEE